MNFSSYRKNSIHTRPCKYVRADRPMPKNALRIFHALTHVGDRSENYTVVEELICTKDVSDSVYQKLFLVFKNKNSLVEKSPGYSTSCGVRLRKKSVQIWQQSVAGQQHITCHSSKIVSKCCGVLGLRKRKDT